MSEQKKTSEEKRKRGVFQPLEVWKMSDQDQEDCCEVSASKKESEERVVLVASAESVPEGSS